jgi:hypothetical protein
VITAVAKWSQTTLEQVMPPLERLHAFRPLQSLNEVLPLDQMTITLQDRRIVVNTGDINQRAQYESNQTALIANS